MFRQHGEATRHLSAGEKQHSQAECVLMISAKGKTSSLHLLGSVAHTQAFTTISDTSGCQRRPHGAGRSTGLMEMWALGKKREELHRDPQQQKAICLQCFKIHPFFPELSIFLFDLWSLSLMACPSLAYLRLIHWLLYWSLISLFGILENDISIY